MPRRTRDEASRQKILSGYERAKASNPRLTQAQYMVKGSPTFAARYEAAKTAEDRKRVEQSAARYFRLMREGKRTGSVQYEKGSVSKVGSGRDMFQVVVRDRTGNTRSFDLQSAGARSTFDIPFLESRLKGTDAGRKLIQQKRQEWATRYEINDYAIDDEDIEVRRVQTFSKVPLHLPLL